MNQRKGSGQTASNERSQASKGGRKSGSQGGRTGGEASSGKASGPSSGQGNRSQSEDARHGIQQSRKSSSK